MAEYGILGPLTAHVDGSAVELGGSRTRAVLAVLLLERNRVVSVDRLVDLVWGGDPPPTAEAALQEHVSRLRRALGAAAIETRSSGYLLRTEPGAVDAERFEELVERARDLPPGEAASTLRQALGLWRGSVLADLAHERFAEAAAARLEEARLNAIAARVEADLASGRRAATPRPVPLPVVVEAPAAPAVTRRTVTIVFADVAGSTALGEQLDPEMMRALMTRYFAAMKDALERHGGTVEKFIGDAVMAVFGIPVLHEDDALRAVRAAEEMQLLLARYGVELETQRGITLRTRIGVNTGEVVAGDPATGQTLVTGDAVNVAARLEQAAGVGQVLMGASTYRLVRDAVVVEPVEPLVLKGKERPVPAYRLRSVTPGADPLARRLDTVLVGRDRELSRVQGAFDDAIAEQRCHLLTLLGAAGVGKTRLVAELARLAASEALVIRGRCLPYGEGITFWPLREMVAAAAGFSDADSADVARSRIAALLAREPDAARIEERIGQVLGLSADQAPRDELFWAVRRLFGCLASERPLIAVFDDLHWAERTLLDLVASLVDQGGDVPMLVVGAARAELLERHPTWGGGQHNATTVMLEALSPAASERLLVDLVGDQVLPVPLRDRLVSTAEGNPLFLQELIAGLVDDGRLQQTRAGWVVSGDLDTIAIPPTITALVATRLDRLGPAERMILGHAAVMGRAFAGDALLELVTDLGPDDVDGALRVLTRAGLVRAEGTRVDGAGTWRFRHLLIRDLAYGSLSKGVRAALHEAFAGWLLGRRGDRLEELEEIVGYHLEQAHAYRGQLGAFDDELRPLAAQAAGWLAAAGRRAFARHDGPAAASLLTRAAALWPLADERRLAVELLLAELRRGQGDLAGASADLERIRDLAVSEALDGVADRAGILLAWLRSSTHPARWLDEVDVVTRSAEPRLERSSDDEGLSLLWGLRMDAAMARGHVTAARTAAERAIAHGTRAGDGWQITRRSRANLAELSVVDATPIPAAEARCLELLDAVGHERRLEASILFSLARLQAMRGDLATASASVARGRSIADELGLLYGRVVGAETAAFVAGADATGDPAVAAALLREAEELVGARGDQRATIRLATHRAELLVRGGADRAAASVVDALRADAGALSAGIETRMLLAGLAGILAARRGNGTGARVDAAEALEIAGSGESPMWLAHALALSAEALGVLGDDDARRHAARSVELYERKGATALAARVRATPWWDAADGGGGEAAEGVGG